MKVHTQAMSLSQEAVCLCGDSHCLVLAGLHYLGECIFADATIASEVALSFRCLGKYLLESDKMEAGCGPAESYTN